MEIITFDEWKIAVNREKTKELYANRSVKNTQAQRNFAAYCEQMPQEERELFCAFGIEPQWCTIDHISKSSYKKEVCCEGYFFAQAAYLKAPEPQPPISIEAFAENGGDPRPSPWVERGVLALQFLFDEDDFQYLDFEIPPGCICVQFVCDPLPWLLNETCEADAFLPPRWWELGKKRKERRAQKQGARRSRESDRKQFAEYFAKYHVQATVCGKHEIRKHKRRWLAAFAPKDVSQRELRKHCLRQRPYQTYLWHLFSFEYVPCDTGASAQALFDRTDKTNCVLLENRCGLAYRLPDAGALNAHALSELNDVVITAPDFSWTYAVTHEAEDGIGPYFYQKPAKE